jgi:hypothetical protein
MKDLIDVYGVTNDRNYAIFTARAGARYAHALLKIKLKRSFGVFYDCGIFSPADEHVSSPGRSHGAGLVKNSSSPDDRCGKRVFTPG